MSAPPIKILIFGPSKGGKSGVASFLSGSKTTMNYSPGPTVGVRIFSFERNNTNIELWDVSGDQSYETSWPAVTKDADGGLLIFNADIGGQAKEAELWIGWIKPVVCACVGFTSIDGALSTPSSNNPSGLTLPSLPGPGTPGAGAFSGPVELLSVTEGGDSMRRVFDKLILRIAKRRG